VLEREDFGGFERE